MVLAKLLSWIPDAASGRALCAGADGGVVAAAVVVSLAASLWIAACASVVSVPEVKRLGNFSLVAVGMAATAGSGERRET